MKKINITDKDTEDVVVETKEEVIAKPDTPVVKEATPLQEKDSLKKKVSSTTDALPKKKWILILSIIGLLLISGITSFYYFGIYKYNPKAKSEDLVTVTKNYIRSGIASEVFASTLVGQPQEPRTEVSPINGLLFTKSEMEELMTRRPVAVMINNHVQARPQSGLNSADIVYEVLVESGITRHMGIFWSQAPTKVGPVRSARQCYLEWLSPYDALYIHDGCASSDDARVDACGNLYDYNIKDLSTIGSWRWNDGVRYAPHNEYNSITNAWDYAENRNWDKFPSSFESWKFKNDATIDERGEGYRYEVTFHKQLTNGGDYDAIWQYDNATNSYSRWIGGKLDIDQETNTQVTSKIVVIQETTITPTYDSKAHIIVTTIGQGSAVILMDGKEIDATWKKTSRTDRTTFYNTDGTEIEFNRGRIWISVISQSTGKFDIIEQ